MGNILETIKEVLSGNFSFLNFGRAGSVIGIDIGSAFLKVVQLKKSEGKAILETYGELALGPYADLYIGQATSLPVDKISEAINDLFKEANITTKNSGISIPLSSSLMSTIEMPKIDKGQLKKMIPIEARKYIPVPISEVTLDWWVLPERKKRKDSNSSDSSDNGKDKTKKKKMNKLSVLIVAIHNEVLNKYREIVSGVGLSNTFMELEVFCTARSTFGNNMPSVMILDLGAGSTKISIMEYGIIKSQHIINKGSQNITQAISKALGVSIKEAEDLKLKIGLLGVDKEKEISEIIELIIDNIFAEANRVLLNYQRMYNRTIKNVVLAGGGATLKGLNDFSKKNLETEVIYADPFSKTETPAFLDPLLKEVGPGFAVALGVALRKLQEME